MVKKHVISFDRGFSQRKSEAEIYDVFRWRCDSSRSSTSVAFAVVYYGYNTVTPATAFPAALQDAVAAFYYLLDQSYSAKTTCPMGDSGGASSVLMALLYLRGHELDLPGSSALRSPFVDVADDSSGDSQKLKYDILNPGILSNAAYQYSGNRPDLRSTLLSPARNNLPAGHTFAGLPNMFVDYGDTEVFAPLIQRFVQAVKNFGVQLEVNEPQDKVHCYSYNAGDGIASGFCMHTMPKEWG